MVDKIITVDGPSGVGKGTLAAFLSLNLGWKLLDSGAIYRAAALYLKSNDLSVNDEESILKLKKMPIKFVIKEGKSVCLLGGEDVSSEIRTEESGIMASRIAVLADVRSALLECQKSFNDGKGLIADGRDMGSVVFPNAPLKLYLSASAESRANRRYKELKHKGLDADYNEVLKNIIERDHRDQTRKASPLKPAKDAVIVDTSDLTIQQVQGVALAEIKKIKKVLKTCC